ncbi:MAG: Threonine synthase [Firmicutes bacterium ADurb.Bin193]|nr:MAG: Threonine synthase [Firmicutes bacterium ADurb.Bin193]
MEYQSTRSKDYSCTSAEAIKEGLAKDGGLFVPGFFPKILPEEIEKMAEIGYNARAFNILRRFLTDFTDKEISDSVNAAYNKTKFETESITPVYKLNNQVYFLELWHGLTCAFKDVALQILPHLLTRSIEKTGDGRTAVILVATSGDTGKAALEGFRDVAGTKIAVFYPESGVSGIQKLQMTTQEGENVAVGGILGNFDDAQTAVKQIFTDEEYKSELDKKGYMLSSANSINWGRLVPQIVYYFSAYCDLLKSEEIKSGEQVNFVVPTGNFGDILAGYYAKLMGLPINKLICASNKNNVLTDFINTGVYSRNRSFYRTSSPSMDILVSSNLERFLYDITGKDRVRIKDWMESLSSKGEYEVPDITKQKIKEVLWGGFCNEEDTLFSIKDTFEAYGYIMDPHTAVGKNVYDQYLFETGDDTKSIILSTASPFKFNKDVLEAIRGKSENTDEFTLLEELSHLAGMKIPNSLKALKSKEIRFPDSIDKAEMKEFINSKLKL